MTARKTALVAQLYYSGKRWSCSEDDMETRLARKEQQFPDRRATDEDGTRSFGRAAASSFTRTAEVSQPLCWSVRQDTINVVDETSKTSSTDHRARMIALCDSGHSLTVTPIGPLLELSETLKCPGTGLEYAPSLAPVTEERRDCGPPWCCCAVLLAVATEPAPPASKKHIVTSATDLDGRFLVAVDRVQQRLGNMVPLF